MHSDTLTLERRRKVAKTSKTNFYNIYRIASLIYAFLFFLFPVVIIAVIYFVYRDTRIYVGVALEDTVYLPSLLSLISLVFVVLAPIVGIYGLIKQCPKSVKAFAILASCYIVSQICIACIIFIYREKDINFDIMRDNLNRIVADTQYKTYMNHIQQNLGCCGIDGPQDYQLYVTNFECIKSQLGNACELPKGCCYGTNPKEACEKNNKNRMRKALSMQEHISVDKRYKDEQWIRFLFENEISNRSCGKYMGRAMDRELFKLGLAVVSVCLVNIIGMFFVVMLLVKMGDRKNLYNYNKDRSRTPML